MMMTKERKDTQLAPVVKQNPVSLECTVVLLSGLDTTENETSNVDIPDIVDEDIKPRLQPLIRLLMSSMVCNKGAQP